MISFIYGISKTNRNRHVDTESKQVAVGGIEGG